MLEDTIAAIATPLGEGGIGIVRISGSAALRIAKELFVSKYQTDWDKGPNHRLIYGHIRDPRDEKIIDEVLLGIMRSPASYTREDVVEINCHGGIVPLKKILELVLICGARLAEPGEFTKRAFINGRLDLAQAESVIDIIRAKTEDGLQLAVNQLKGNLSEKINEFQNELLNLLARIEAVIDFPEEDIEASSLEKISSNISDLLMELNNLIKSAQTGKIYRDGLATVIAGKPNVGKSSLLNALVREKRAIVTDIPGTTRDVIEEYINIKGIPLKIIDTAGIRETDNPVEKIGVEKSHELLEQADLILYMVDADTGLLDSDKEILSHIKREKLILIINKIDLVKADVLTEKLRGLYPNMVLIKISALNNTGIDELEDAIANKVFEGEVVASDRILISNVRHKNALSRAKKHLEDVQAGIMAGTPADIISIDLRAAWEVLGEINGSTISEDIIDKIFADFCIGK
ncbi:tRNA uridine-5-carboxymethylaminomethyl(34) synthesis GTPase MnmE [Desulfolucanica intricata]|uniref:tRNA uridine-5-carboxymethylaminomethyl(34) synthesis GTPase MnmE n=1 Tax=Desulfolucanica intricata TaxID=1285191 RepID=UPI000831090C|nr:tRNA uridine-5-carboxymethylaminomethyl(34) synthesis GTPase MnmE [Desulfolucanica intricata]